MWSWLIRLSRDQGGGYSVLAAAMMPVLVGFTALGTETGLWFYQHQTMQSAADGAAFSAGAAYFAGNTTTFATDGKAVAATYGFTDGTNNTTVTVNQPPASGPNVSTPGAVEVIITQPQQRLFSAVLLSSTVSISARAVSATSGQVNACVLGLDPTAANTVLISNNAVLPDPACGVVSNSSSSTGFTVNNNAVVDGPTSSHGGTSLGVNAHLNGNPNLTNAATVADPYASANPGTPPACTSQNGTGSNNGSRNLVPDVVVNGVGMAHFCSGLNFQNNFSATFAPGVYFIDSQLVFGNNALISGTNVTLVINGNYQINIGNNATVNISAPLSGPTAGIAFMGGRSATSSVVQTFSNNTILNLTGAIYFPNQILNFDNNGSTTSSGCTQLIARQVQIMNNVALYNNCNNTGTKPINFGGSVALVE